MKKTYLPLVIALLTVSLVATAQNRNQNIKLGKEYGKGVKTLAKGWYFGFGLTYMQPYLKETSTFDTLNTRYEYEAKPKGKFGATAEIGLFKMTNRKIINYRDFGLRWKWFRAGENFTQTSYVNNSVAGSVEQEGKSSDHLLSLHYNLGYRYDRDERMFFLNGLGLNADYFLIKKRTDSGVMPNVDHQYPNNFVVQMHYFFGIGFVSASKKTIIMPMIETPIVNFMPFTHIVSTHPYFNTRFRPILLTVRFMFLRQNKSCPPVYNPAGVGPES
jgi:hypothetical protein